MKTTRRFPTRMAACGTLLALAACSADSRPRAGDYVLRKIDDGAPPALVAHDQGCSIVLVAATMKIAVADSFSSKFSLMRHCRDSSVSQIPDPGTSGPFATKADTVYFSTSDGRNGGMGIFKADTLTVTGPQHRLTYVRKADK